MDAEKLKVLCSCLVRVAEMSDYDKFGFLTLMDRYVSMANNAPMILRSPATLWSPATVPYDTLGPAPEDPAKIKNLLDKLVVLKLNGGLETTMGCTGPKSSLEVCPGLTFLDLSILSIMTLNAIYKCNVPLVLMNSFNSHDDALKTIKKYAESNIRIRKFDQSQYPYVFAEDLTPLALRGYDGKDAWYPPGHGDVFPSLINSRVLQELLDEEKEYILICNSDNLGANVDLKILNHLVNTKNEYCMEVTPKTEADVKGSILVSSSGKLQLLEIAQVSASLGEDEFKSNEKFPILNTNNLWVNLQAIKRLVRANAPKMPIIPTQKKLGDLVVLQLETAAGDAIRFFENPMCINVPRLHSRFIPVKTTSDLLLVQSDLYILSDGYMIRNPKRTISSNPLIELGPEFQKIGDFLSRVKFPLSVVGLETLTVKGDVWFGAETKLKGKVTFSPKPGKKLNLPGRTRFCNEIITSLDDI